MKKTVGVTGATGNIGKVLVPQLLEKGYQVKVLARNPAKCNWKVKGNIKIVKGDVTDIVDLKSFLKDLDYLIHMAVVMDLSKPEAEFEKVNVESVKNILKYADKRTKIVMLSSVTVYKDCGRKCRDESWNLRATPAKDMYAATKIKALKAVRESKRKVVSVMPSIVIDKKSFGREEQALSSPLRNFIWKHLGGGIPGGIMAAVGSGRRMIAFIEVEDAAGGIIQAMEKGKPGEEYILNGENIEAAEYLRKMGTKLRKNYLKIRIPSIFLHFFGLAQLQSMNFSAEKARRKLGFSPTWKL